MHLANVTSFFSFFQRRTSENGISKQPNINVTNGLLFALDFFVDSVSASTIGLKSSFLNGTTIWLISKFEAEI
jgi:hypothetical protein